MAIKSLFAFIGILACLVLFLFAQESYIFELSKRDNTIAQITLEKAKNYEITPNGIQSITTADKVIRYIKHDDFENVVLLQKDEELLSVISALHARLTDEQLSLRNSVTYTRSDNLTYKSEEALYDRKKEILSSDVPFVGTRDGDEFEGQSFTYSVKEKVLNANRVKMTIQTEKK